MSCVGVLGGTFNPIHFGHLITASAIKEIRKLDKIIFVPCFISPHKVDNKPDNSLDRLEMVKLAIGKTAGFEYSDYEITKGGISYTIDTLTELNKVYSKLELIIGYDNLLKFHTWKEPDKILEMAELIVMKRKTDKPPVTVDQYFSKAKFVDTPLIEISATDIRSRIKSGMSIDFLVPEKVKEYICTFNLYR